MRRPIPRTEEGEVADAATGRAYDQPVRGSSIEGLWVILVTQEGAMLPMLARAGSGLYLLAFKTGFTARKFVTDSKLTDAEPRMVVSANLAEVISALEGKEIAGVLIDYDATTNTYKEAGLMY
jgi:type IV secretory pathway TraG/TraD family ATPase VirD4